LVVLGHARGSPPGSCSPSPPTPAGRGAGRFKIMVRSGRLRTPTPSNPQALNTTSETPPCEAGGGRTRRGAGKPRPAQVRPLQTSSPLRPTTSMVLEIRSGGPKEVLAAAGRIASWGLPDGPPHENLMGENQGTAGRQRRRPPQDSWSGATAASRSWPGPTASRFLHGSRPKRPQDPRISSPQDPRTSGPQDPSPTAPLPHCPMGGKRVGSVWCIRS